MPTYHDHVYPLVGTTGGWLENQFIICGGVDEMDVFKECFKIGKRNINHHGNMIYKRANAASIVLGENLWVLGGYGNSNSLITSEYISAIDGSSKEGPNLPIGLANHATVKINSTYSMLIGGDCLDFNDDQRYTQWVPCALHNSPDFFHIDTEWADWLTLGQFRYLADQSKSMIRG